jgi:hypothetical protein
MIPAACMFLNLWSLQGLAAPWRQALSMTYFDGLLSSHWRADLGANDFTGDDQFDPPILLSACGRPV